MPSPLVEPFYTEMGKRLRYYRESALMTQTDLALRMGLFGRQNISAYENGRVRLHMHQAVKVCGILHITLDELATD